MKRRAMVSCFVGLVACLRASAASAYQNPQRFGDGIDTGGGGGRYFTGAPLDSYTCVVCHTGGQPTAIKVLGLPVDGYTPGQTYMITVDWDDMLKSVALNLEVTDNDGQPMGTLQQPDPSVLMPADLCANLPVPTLHVVPTDPMQMRLIGLVSECGAHQATVAWTAPMFPPMSRKGWFSGSLVVSNSDGKVGGDTVVDFLHPLAAMGEPVPSPSQLTAGCSASGTRGSEADPGAAAIASVLAMLALLTRSRGARSRA